MGKRKPTRQKQEFENAGIQYIRDLSQKDDLDVLAEIGSLMDDDTRLSRGARAYARRSILKARIEQKRK